MKKITYYIVLLSLFTNVYAVNKTGTMAAKFLSKNIGSKAIGMGGAFTAIANDVGYENIFINQLNIHYKKGDMLILISASGNSLNLIKAAEWVKNKRGDIFCLLGFNGGKLKKICNASIHLKTNDGEYGFVEDCHLIINHVCSCFIKKIIIHNFRYD